MPPSRRKAFSCNSAQIWELERNTSSGTALRRSPGSAQTGEYGDTCRCRSRAPWGPIHNPPGPLRQGQSRSPRRLPATTGHADHGGSAGRFDSTGEAAAIDQVLPDALGVCGPSTVPTRWFPGGARRHYGRRIRSVGPPAGMTIQCQRRGALRLDWPVLPPGGRGSLGWPVLPAHSVPIHPADADRCPPLADNRRQSLAGRRWSSESSAATNPTGPMLITCCFFSSFKTLLTSTEGSRPRVKINILNDGYRWPVLN